MSTKITEHDLDPNMDMAHESTSQQILEAVNSMETNLSGTLTANVVKSVQRGVITIASGDKTGTAKISAVNTSKAVVINTGSVYNYDLSRTQYSGEWDVRLDLTSDQVTATLSPYFITQGCTVSYQVIEYY